ncbi:hypothetical protein L6R49_02410 [Myxococcota bacterium]|nr:hypothetical protein [Myxococcota bacterium]
MLTMLGSVLGGCQEYNIPHIELSEDAEHAAYNCDVLALASDWDCSPEDRVIPLSCSWGDKDRSGAVTIEGSTGCVTMTCAEVLYRAENECTYDQNGETVLHDNTTAECCTADDCGVEFGCY